MKVFFTRFLIIYIGALLGFTAYTLIAGKLGQAAPGFYSTLALGLACLTILFVFKKMSGNVNELKDKLFDEYQSKHKEQQELKKEIEDLKKELKELKKES